MRFWSKYAGFQQFCRHEVPEVRDPTGRHLVTPKMRALIADFGVHMGEQTWHNPETDRDEMVPDIRGHYFDTIAAQQQLKWTDEEREIVEEVLIDISQNIPDFCRLIEDVKLSPPWGNYDEVAHTKIAQLALELDVVREALAYEAENKNRPTVIEKLRIAMGDEPHDDESGPDDEEADALVAAVS